MLNLPKNLFLLPFDHRGSFKRDLFGIAKRDPTPVEVNEILRYKHIIFEGFKRAVERGVPKESAGILVDEQFGSQILREAKTEGYCIACSVEKSGQKEFDFEYGKDFRKHILDIAPDFVKVLVRYNSSADAAKNLLQAKHLKVLSDFCIESKFRFMFELLVPPTTEELAEMHADSGRYDSELRPQLMVNAIKELQDCGVEPDVWKVEGLTTKTSYQKVVDQARSEHRDHVGLIVLGRGENDHTIEQWLSLAAQTTGFIGFAIGRTVWEESLKEFKAGAITEEDAVEKISIKFKSYCDLWLNATL